VGKQAQVIPELISLMDQQEDATLSQVTSSVNWRYFMRMMEMAQV